MANPRFVGARLRKDFDEDLFQATKEMDSNSKSDLIRTGMRLALGITTHKVVQVKEMPVAASPSIWRPQKR